MKAIICGTKRESIGRYIADELVQANWEMWLYSRSVARHDDGQLHFRTADVAKVLDVKQLLDETGPLDLVVLSADAGGVFGELSTLNPGHVQNFLNAKILGSVNIVQEIIRRGHYTKLVFLCGKNGVKDKDYLLYAVVNAALCSLVNNVNVHYGDTLQAYYLETPPIANSSIAHEHRERLGKDIPMFPMSVLLYPLLKIIDGSILPGFVPFAGGPVQ
ncbi:MAG: hypothetical protein AAB947_00795 [Patescibacteria group bacterium]